MKNTLKSQFVLAIVLFGLITPSFAQDSTPASVSTPAKSSSPTNIFRTWSVGVNAGLLAPVVAIGGSNDFTKWKPTFGYGFYIKNQFTHHIAVQAEFLKGTLEANNNKELGDGTSPQREYSSFKTDLNWAASISGVITLANDWFTKRNVLIPYLSVGGGLASYNPTLQTNTTKIDYKPDGSIKEFFIPVGAGLKLNVSQGVNIDLGYRMNFVDGDNLDGYYYGPQKDKFSYGFAGLEIALGNKTASQLMLDNPSAGLKKDLQDENMALRSSLEQQAQQNATQVTALSDELNKMKKDSDGDGVSDYFDKCPSTPAGEKVDGSGCSLPKTEPKKDTQYVITEEDRRILNEAIQNLEFDFGKSTIRAKSYPSLDKVAEILVKKHFSLKLAGHTDNVGSESANMKLSKSRAEAVKTYLVSQGANPSRIEATGYGESQPIASNKTNAGRQQNRRVEFTLY